MNSWLWIICGFLLLGLEVVTPSGFILLFFGLGALTVGGLALLGLILQFNTQLFLFTAFSLVYLLLFRRFLNPKSEPKERVGDRSSMVGDIVVALEEIPAGAFGQVDARGTQWQAKNNSSEVIAVGQRCRVSAMDGVKLVIVKE